MKKTLLITTLMLGVSLATMAKAADPSYENCANGSATCTSCGTNCYFAVTGTGADKTMTVYGPTTAGTTGSVDTPITFGCGDSDCTTGYTMDGYADVKNLVVTGNIETIADNAFRTAYGDSAAHFESITLSDSVKNIGKSVFRDQTHVTNLHLSSNLETVGYYAFQNIYGVTGALTLPDTLTTIGEGAFNNMHGITGALVIPDGVTSIERFAFSDMRGITSLTIPDSVTTIEDYAFQYMLGLTSLVIPDSVIDIENSAFYGMNNLRKLYCPAPAEGSVSICSGKGSYASIQNYVQDPTTGVYKIVDSEGNVLKDANGNDRYYSTPDNMASGTICNNADGTCATEAAAYQKAKQDAKLAKAAAKSQAALQAALDNQAAALLASGAVCSDIETCKAIVYADYNGTTIKVGGYEYASLADLQAGNHLPKRIYTIDEANAVAGVKNRVSIRYR